MTTFVATVPADSIVAGRPHAVVVGETELVLCRDGDEIFAVSNRCSHLEVKLERGTLSGRTLTCLAHGARFDITSGACLGGPTRQGIASYPVRVENGMVLVGIERKDG